VSLSILKIPTAKIFEPLLAPSRYKAVYGGRGSGKSHFFGELLVETCQAERGTLAVCIREAQRTLAQSSKRLIESKVASLGLGHRFKAFSDKIETPGDGIIIFRGMQDHTADSIKSLEGFRIAWVDEAQTLSARSLALLRPTIRKQGSELWASWKPLRSAPGAELLAGTIIQGTPYVAVYNNSDAAFYLQGFYGNPYNVPLLGGMDFWDTIAPNSSFIFPAGQAVSRTTYATAFARWGTTFGAGDGSTTFNVPDKTGRVSAMKEASATRLTSSYFGGNSMNMGAVGGGESHILNITEIPSHNHNFNDPGHSHTVGGQWLLLGAGGNTGGGGSGAGFVSITTNSSGTGITFNAQGGGNPHVTVQPTIVCNYIVRIL
jgi:microcystin-dependent protein